MIDDRVFDPVWRAQPVDMIAKERRFALWSRHEGRVCGDIAKVQHGGMARLFFGGRKVGVNHFAIVLAATDAIANQRALGLWRDAGLPMREVIPADGVPFCVDQRKVDGLGVSSARVAAICRITQPGALYGQIVGGGQVNRDWFFRRGVERGDSVLMLDAAAQGAMRRQLQLVADQLAEDDVHLLRSSGEVEQNRRADCNTNAGHPDAARQSQ